MERSSIFPKRSPWVPPSMAWAEIPRGWITAWYGLALRMTDERRYALRWLRKLYGSQDAKLV